MSKKVLKLIDGKNSTLEISKELKLDLNKVNRHCMNLLKDQKIQHSDNKKIEGKSYIIYKQK